MDFVYRSFFYGDWILWAETEWDDWCRERNRENRWARLVAAFNQSAVRVLASDADLQRDLEDLRRCLSVQREKFFVLRTDEARRKLVG